MSRGWCNFLWLGRANNPDRGPMTCASSIPIARVAPDPKAIVDRAHVTGRVRPTPPAPAAMRRTNLRPRHVSARLVGV